MTSRSYFSRRQRQFNPHHLPAPIHYYRHLFPKLSAITGWVSVRCCFHEDARPSLRINLDFGGFHCFGCGEKGGDIIAFHQKRYQLTFVEAVNYFGAWEYDDAE